MTANCICNECAWTFTAPRADARYCSSACRQTAYRRRKSVTDKRWVRVWVSRDVLVPWTPEHDQRRGDLLTALAEARRTLDATGGVTPEIEAVLDQAADYLTGGAIGVT